MAARKSARKVRYAVVGQGWIAQDAVLPAFAHARENSELAALVSGDPVKLEELGRLYGVTSLYGYDEYDDCLASGEIDAVYIALPNDMHHDFTVRAARAGVHVLCEKPLAVTEAECRSMIRAASQAGIRLMTAYRLHFEAANLAAIEAVREDIGEPRVYSADFATPVAGGNIRLEQERGGGTLYDIGIYCINAARYLFRDEPTEVFAWTASGGQAKFSEVEETSACVMEFPGGRLAHFAATFGASSASTYRVLGTKGHLRVEPAFSHEGRLEHHLTIGEKKRVRVFEDKDQFAPELVHFSDCVLKGRDPEPSGLEGLIDVAIIEALYRSAESRRPVKLSLPERGRRPSRRLQQPRKPAPRKPSYVRASHPSR